MELHIFNRDLELIDIMEGYPSLRWVRRYFKPGEFELHAPLTAENLKLLARGNLVKLRTSKEAGYIQYRSLTQDSSGKEMIAVSGQFVSDYISKRIMWGIFNKNQVIEAHIRELIQLNVISPNDPSRVIPNLVLGQNGGLGPKVRYQTSYSNLLEQVEKLCLASGLGFMAELDQVEKEIVFKVYEGINRSINQTDLSPVIFSTDLDNILEQEYTEIVKDFKNTALIAGEGEGEERVKISIEEGSGLDRIELYVDARDLQREVDEVEIPLEEYKELLFERGSEKLSEYEEVETFESKIDLRSNYTYKEDFDLGDIVTCQSDKWSLTLDSRITEIEEVYEERGMEVNVTFGNNIPTLIDVIKREVR